MKIIRVIQGTGIFIYILCMVAFGIAMFISVKITDGAENKYLFKNMTTIENTEKITSSNIITLDTKIENLIKKGVIPEQTDKFIPNTIKQQEQKHEHMQRMKHTVNQPKLVNKVKEVR